jgi:hypothetical protein
MAFLHQLFQENILIVEQKIILISFFNIQIISNNIYAYKRYIILLIKNLKLNIKVKTADLLL